MNRKTDPKRPVSVVEVSPWQLDMFGRSLKKQLKLKALLRLLGEVADKRCLMITCGDNNGALNWHFRARGGQWSWADLEDGHLAEIEGLLGEPVLKLSEDAFPFDDSSFDCVVCIDVLEHLSDERPFLDELQRVLAPDGRALVTTPNGDPSLLANRVKQLLGMTPDVYGHRRAGYTASELSAAVEQSGLQTLADDGYSGFFTESVELLINFGYVSVLSRKASRRNAGQIAPTSSTELKRHGTAYRVYSMAYPLLRFVSWLDRLLPAGSRYAVIVSAVKPRGVPPQSTSRCGAPTGLMKPRETVRQFGC